MGGPSTIAQGRPEEARVGGKGFDDVLVFAPVRPVVECGDRILGRDGCLNFFAGPLDPNFSAPMNFYNVHYGSTHVLGTSGGNTDDMVESLDLMSRGRINPAAMVTHVGGLDAVIETTLNLPNIPGGKKLIYTGLSMPLTAISDFEEKGKRDPVFAELARIASATAGSGRRRRRNTCWRTPAGSGGRPVSLLSGAGGEVQVDQREERQGAVLHEVEEAELDAGGPPGVIDQPELDAVHPGGVVVDRADLRAVHPLAVVEQRHLHAAHRVRVVPADGQLNALQVGDGGIEERRDLKPAHVVRVVDSDGDLDAAQRVGVVEQQRQLRAVRACGLVPQQAGLHAGSR